jgi:hypothetical protein
MAGLVSVEEEIYTHEHLWRSSSLLLERPRVRSNRRITSYCHRS